MGKTWKIETSSEGFNGMKLGDKVEGKDLSPELAGYDLEITGASDKAGFPAKRDLDGQGLQRVLLKKGWGMHTSRPKGLRLRKTVRGNTISADILQINLKILKEGPKKLEEIFSDQNKLKEKPPAQTSSESVS